jgi:ATP-dependent protease ClpP protease subunit
MNPVKRIFQAAKKATTLELYIYDSIGYDFWTGGGVAAADVAKAIKEAGSYDSILLRINSPGGDVFEGSAIHTLLRTQGKPVNVLVDGIAASAAFTIAMAGDNIEVGEAGMMMLHNGWAMAVGEAKELRQTADLLDKISGQMASIYAARSGQSIESVHAMMDAETWLTPGEAVAKGFANGVMATSDEDAAAAKALASQMLASSKTVKFSHIPDALKAQEVGEPIVVVAEVKPEPKPDAEGADIKAETVPMCECQCSACQMKDCPDCDNESCDDDACSCATDGSDESMSASAAMARNRLRLAEHTAFLLTM